MTRRVDRIAFTLGVLAPYEGAVMTRLAVRRPCCGEFITNSAEMEIAVKAVKGSLISGEFRDFTYEAEGIEDEGGFHSPALVFCGRFDMDEVISPAMRDLARLAERAAGDQEAVDALPRVRFVYDIGKTLYVDDDDRNEVDRLAESGLAA